MPLTGIFKLNTGGFMTKLEEKTVTIKFTLAGYDLDDIDFTALHNDLMCDVSAHVAMFGVVGNFKSEVTTKRTTK